jgi:hypothetical protein
MVTRRDTINLAAIFYKEDARRRGLDAISLKRRNPALSMTRAAKLCGTTIKTVRKYGAPALETRSGRLDVRPTDRLERRMRLLTSQGEIAVRTRSSRTATRLSDYNNAVRKFYATGNADALKAFRNKVVRSGGQRYEFVTDPRVLNRLGRAGAVSFSDIYAAEAKG